MVVKFCKGSRIFKVTFAKRKSPDISGVLVKLVFAFRTNNTISTQNTYLFYANFQPNAQLLSKTNVNWARLAVS